MLSPHYSVHRSVADEQGEYDMTILNPRGNLTITLLFVIFSLSTIFYSVSAQTPEMQKFVSERDYFSVEVPTDWQTEEIVPGAALLTANSDAALERYKSGDMPESGDFVVSFGFLPYNIVQAPQVASLHIQYDASPDVFLQSMMPLFRVSDGASISDAALVSVSDTRDVGVINFSSNGREGSVLVFHAADRVVAFISTVGFPGDTEDFQATLNVIAASTEFTAPQNALWAVMIGQ